MREPRDAFHLAVPVDDLEQAVGFYVTGLGCKLCRRYADRATFDFFGDQLVCHLSPPATEEPTLYPRHFGVTFRDAADFDRLLRVVKLRELRIFREPATRFGGTAEEHRTLVLRDPAGNLVEFKHYLDPRMMY